MATSWRSSGLDSDDVALYEAFAKRAESHLKDFHRLFASLSGDPVKADLEEWRQRRSSALTAIDHLAPVFVEFIQQVALRPPDPALNNFGRTLDFRARFAPRADAHLLAQLEAEFEYLLVAGFALHHLLFDFPTRDQVSAVGQTDVLREWMTKVVAADYSLRAYNKEQDGLPAGVAKLLCKTRLAELLRKRLGLGFWKRGQAESYVKNLFWAGVLLAVIADMQSKNFVSVAR